MLWKSLLRPAFFHLDPEDAHHLTLRALSHWRAGHDIARRVLGPTTSPHLERRLAGLTFPNPLGLAAGLDKHGEAVRAWPTLGFGFVEIGTVTPRPQPGNPRPRLFRLPADRAIVNRFGFNSVGADAVARNLERAGKPGVPLGVNVGKNKETPPEHAIDDYVAAMRVLVPHADYFVVNVSSPNTPALRELQRPETLAALVRAARDAAEARPVFVKLAPDWPAWSALDEAADAVRSAGAAGIIATNTTTSRPHLACPTDEAGGLSGAPLAPLATEVLRLLRARVGPDYPLIGVGGIGSVADARARLAAGADLLQVYTAFIYEGPGLPRRVLAGL